MDAWMPAAGWVVVVSAFTFWVAGVDKRRAQRGAARVREADLLILALLGGSPGLLVAMYSFRHKTRKASFLAKLAAVILVQGLVLWVAWRTAP